MKIPILTYRSMRIDGNDYARDDHVAFEDDLRTIAALGSSRIRTGNRTTLVREYFPRHGARIGIRAAFTSDPSPVTEGSDRWRLGRYVFGRDWKTPEELVRVLQG